MFNILFVCMGNICRSPTAEGFLRSKLERSGLRITADSAGTHDYHIGHPPDERAVREALTFGVDLSGLRARKLVPADFTRFDLILGMDRNNLRLIHQMRPVAATASTGLMMDYAPELGFAEVPDPYYGAQEDFSLMCRLLDVATANLLARLERGMVPVNG